MKFKKMIAILITTALSGGMAHAQEFVGDWKGAIAIQGTTLELIFHVAQKDGQLSTTLDVPMQGVAGIPMENTTMKDEKTITISAPKMGVSYEGEMKEGKIEGEFAQAGMKLPLVLEKFKSKLPGDVTLVTPDAELKKLAQLDNGTYKYNVKDYFAKPKMSGFQLSTDGKYMSYQEKDDKGKRHVMVKDVKTGEIKRAIEEKDELIRGYFWANGERLLYVMDNGGNENYHLFATNFDGANTKDLTPFDSIQVSILKVLKEQKDMVIISLNKNNKQIFEPYKLNIVTGELTQLYENKDVNRPIQGYDFDKDGVLRAYSVMVNGTQVEVYYKDLATGKFNLIKKSNWDEGFSIVGFSYNPANKDEAYVVTNLESDKTKIFLYDLKKNRPIREVFSNSSYDVSGLRLSRKRNYEIDYFSYEGEKAVIVPVSKVYKELYALAKKKFGDKEVNVADFDDNEDNFLIFVHSEKLYGTYYQFNSKTKQFTLLMDLMPQLKEADMAEMRPITFKSRDGLTLHGYVTLPKEALDGKKVPLIVNPHGGPQGVRDSWGFNPETQLFASRGYATLQVNFRISGGYGKEFLRAGFKQVGRKVMDDVEDGVKYMISTGMINPDKIAIYGASHGGYAALMGLVRTPDLYVCSIDYCGISNIETFFSSFPEYWKPYKELVKEIWYDLDNPEEAKIAKEVSPFYQVAKIKKPLMVIQGANDPRVNINESDIIVKALRAKGFEVPFMVKYNEGHGYSHEDNSIDMYQATLGFFAKYLK